MTLATRCTACGTVFRVVQDQLRVSEGWVRCGRCNQVFNAAEHLVDLSKGLPASAAAGLPPPAPPSLADVPPPAPSHAGVPEPAVPATTNGPPAAAMEELSLPAGLVQSDGAVSPDADIPMDRGPEGAGDDGWVADANPPGGIDEAVPSPPVPAGTTVSVHVQLPAASVDDTARAGAAAAPDAVEPEAVGEAQSTEQAEPAEPAWAAEGPSPPTPSFLQRADRAARWQRPAVRRSLLATALLLLTALTLQVAVEYRDFVAARWTATRPLLEALCRWSNCRIEAPRWIEALAVDSSGLVRVEGTNTYRLSVVLHNRSAMIIALPSIDLTLTDTQGRVIARRAFLAGELGTAVTTVAPASELPLAATLAIAERPVSGYTIEIFYP